MKLSHNSKEESKARVYASRVSRRQRIMAADEEFGDEFEDDFMEPDLEDQLDDISDDIEDLQEDVDEEVDQEDPEIEVENNIENHYIAECEKCHGVFISAVVESDEEITKVTGKCPLCDHETDQYLNWIIRGV